MKDFTFLKKASKYADVRIIVGDEKFNFTRTHCFGQIQFTEDYILISQDTGIRYKPISKIYYSEIKKVIFDLNKGTIYTKYISDPRKMMLFFPIIILECANDEKYMFRNGNILSYPKVYQKLKQKNVDIEEVYKIYDRISVLSTQSEMTDAMLYLLDIVPSMWENK